MERATVSLCADCGKPLHAMAALAGPPGGRYCPECWVKRRGPRLTVLELIRHVLHDAQRAIDAKIPVTSGLTNRLAYLRGLLTGVSECSHDEVQAITSVALTPEDYMIRALWCPRCGSFCVRTRDAQGTWNEEHWRAPTLGPNTPGVPP